jgi:hypothetical protein
VSREGLSPHNKFQPTLTPLAHFSNRTVTAAACARLNLGVDMICIATSCAKRASKPRFLAQVLSKSFDF